MRKEKIPNVRVSVNEDRIDLTKLSKIKSISFFSRYQGVGLLLSSLIQVTDAKTVLEIGTGEGYTAICIALSLPEDGKVYTVDIDSRKLSKRAVPEAKELQLSDKIEFIIKDSKDLEWDKEIDILFLDGDHSYEGISSDFLKFSPYVKQDGIILFHDSWHKDNEEKEAVLRFIRDMVVSDWNCIFCKSWPGVVICQKKMKDIRLWNE